MNEASYPNYNTKYWKALPDLKHKILKTKTQLTPASQNQKETREI